MPGRHVLAQETEAVSPSSTLRSASVTVGFPRHEDTPEPITCLKI